MITHRNWMALLAGLAALAFAGCGGDDGPSLADFAKDAEKVCDDGEKKLDAVETPQDVAAVPKFTEDVKKVANEVSDDMGALDTPSGDDGDKAGEFVDSFQADISDTLLPKLDEIKQTAEGGDEKATAAALREIGELDTDKTDKLARDIGADSCAE